MHLGVGAGVRLREANIAVPPQARATTPNGRSPMRRFTMQFTEEVWGQLYLRCQKEGRTVTDLVNTAVERELEDEAAVVWTGDPLLKIKGRFRTRERLRESIWRAL